VRGLVETIAKALVDDPAPVDVTEAKDPNGGDLYRLRVAKADLGKVIGKKGRTAKAFRSLLSAAAQKQGKNAGLEILEPIDTDPVAAEPAAPPSADA
jgi:uncharacterized protein